MPAPASPSHHGISASILAFAAASTFLAGTAAAQVAPAPSPSQSPSMPSAAPATAPAAEGGLGSALTPSPAPAGESRLSEGAPHPVTAATQPSLSVAQPFVADITADRVYVRSGPSTTYYELGQLSKGDMVYVVGASKGWYQILPPNGVYCLIAKEFVDVDPSGTSGTVKNDYVNVRAGTAIYKNRDPFAVLTVARKGTRLKVLGSNDKYVEVAPPEHAYVYVSPQFVKQTSAEYKVPDLKLPSGVTGPTNTVSAPANPPTLTSSGTAGATIELEPPGTPGHEAGPSSVAPPNQGVAGGTLVPMPSGTEESMGGSPQAAAATQSRPPALRPAVTYSEGAAQRFNELNTRYQDELRKPLAQRNIDDLLGQYKDLLKQENLAPSVKLGSESRIDALEKMAAVQRLAKDAAASDQSLAQQREALQQQYSAAEKLISEYQRSSPFVAEGLLQSSTIVKGKYALVNPSTGRVVAYVDPNADVDISTLLGKYVGLRGTTSQPADSDITVIHVANATLLPAPAAGTP